MDNKILIIVEGMDNIGKDTLIDGIKEHYNNLNIKEIHFSGPKSKNTNIAYVEQIKQFIQKLLDIYKDKKDNDLIIWNRSHIGEYVYGQIYRKLNHNEVKRLINLIDDELNKIENIKVVYVQLICTSNTLIINNEDGKSLSNSAKDYKDYLKKIKEERKLFKTVYDIVSNNFNKILIEVNNGEDFIDKTIILNKTIDKINESLNYVEN